MAGFGKWRIGLIAMETVGRVTPVILDVVEEHTGLPPEAVTDLVKARIDEERESRSRVSRKTVNLFVEAVSSLLTDLES